MTGSARRRSITLLTLILCTVDRTDEPADFLESLEGQTRGDFEVLLVDQNEDARLDALVAAHPGLRLRHLRASRGLSHARNVALPLVSGDIVGFPDDDCRYAASLVRRVTEAFEDQPGLDVLTGRASTYSGRDAVGRWRRGPQRLTRRTILGTHASPTMFVRAEVARRVGPFDETLGAGAGTRFGAGEETDWLLRALALGARGRYDPALLVSHPVPGSLDGEQRAKARAYGRGMGHVLRRHRYPAWWGPYWASRPLASALLALGRGDARGTAYHAAAALGRLEGWRA